MNDTAPARHLNAYTTMLCGIQQAHVVEVPSRRAGGINRIMVVASPLLRDLGLSVVNVRHELARMGIKTFTMRSVMLAGTSAAPRMHLITWGHAVRIARRAWRQRAGFDVNSGKSTAAQRRRTTPAPAKEVSRPEPPLVQPELPQNEPVPEVAGSTNNAFWQRLRDKLTIRLQEAVNLIEALRAELAAERGMRARAEELAVLQ